MHINIHSFIFNISQSCRRGSNNSLFKINIIGLKSSITGKGNNEPKKQQHSNTLSTL